MEIVQKIKGGEVKWILSSRLLTLLLNLTVNSESTLWIIVLFFILKFTQQVIFRYMAHKEELERQKTLQLGIQCYSIVEITKHQILQEEIQKKRRFQTNIMQLMSKFSFWTTAMDITKNKAAPKSIFHICRKDNNEKGI